MFDPLSGFSISFTMILFGVSFFIPLSAFPTCFLPIDLGLVFPLSVIDLNLGDFELTLWWLGTFLEHTFRSLMFELPKLILENSFSNSTLLSFWDCWEFFTEGVVIYLI